MYHHFSPVSPLPKSKVSSSPTNLSAFTWDLLFAAIPSKPVEKFLSPIVEGSSENQTALQFSLPLLVWSALEMGFSVNGMKKNPLIYYTEASVWYLLLNILCMKKCKTPKLQNSLMSLLKEYNQGYQKSLWKTPELMLFIQPYSHQRDVRYTAVFIRMMRCCTLWCRRINMTEDLLYLEGVHVSVLDPPRSILGRQWSSPLDSLHVHWKEVGVFKKGRQCPSPDLRHSVRKAGSSPPVFSWFFSV